MRFLRSAPFLRRLMLVAGILALTPATGTALCLGELGHVAIELVDQACFPTGIEGAGDACATECRGCEDIPLTFDVADRVSSRDALSDGLQPPAAPVAGIFPGCSILPPAPQLRSVSDRPLPISDRPSLLRC